MILVTKTSDQARQRDTPSLLLQFLLKPRVPCASLPASLLFYRLSGSAAYCLLFFLSTQPSLPHSPHRVYNSCRAVSCASSLLLRPPRFRPRFCSHLRYYCSRFRPRFRPRSHLVFVHGSLPLIHSRPRFHIE